jgi:hypothetical protein
MVAQRQCRLHAKVRVRVAQQQGERRGHVHLNHRQQLQGTAEDIEVPMLAAQCLDERRDEVTRRVTRQSLDHAAARLPAGRLENVHECTGLVQSLERLQARGGVLPDGWVVAPELFRQRALDIEPRGHVLDCGHHADDAIAFPQRAKRDELLHPIEMIRPGLRRTGDQVLVEGRGQEVRLAGLGHPLKVMQEPTLSDVRKDLRQRASMGGLS